jgi:hypothetical protein
MGMARRGIPLGSVPFEDATMYLLRVVVDEDDEPPAINGLSDEQDR